MAKPIRAMDLAPRTGTIYPPPYAVALAGRAKRALGDAFGLSQFGVNLTVLAPGTASAERHWHEKEDEFVYILEGEVVLIDEQGEQLLTPGMCAGFKAGDPNAHKLVNRSSSPVILLEVGTRSEGDRAHYPEAGMAAEKIDGKFRITRKDGPLTSSHTRPFLAPAPAGARGENGSPLTRNRLRYI